MCSRSSFSSRRRSTHYPDFDRRLRNRSTRPTSRFRADRLRFRERTFFRYDISFEGCWCSHQLTFCVSDPWAAPAPKPPVAPQPRLSTTPRVTSPLTSPRPASVARSITPSDSGKADVTSSPAAHSTAGMSKEEKATEMARRKEERKQVGTFRFGALQNVI